MAHFIWVICIANKTSSSVDVNINENWVILERFLTMNHSDRINFSTVLPLSQLGSVKEKALSHSHYKVIMIPGATVEFCVEDIRNFYFGT